MPRKVLILLIGLALLLVAGHTIYWGIVQQRLREQFALWVGVARANGWTVTNAPPSSGGWPLAAKLTVPEMSVKGGDPDVPGGLAWSTVRVELRIALLRPTAIKIEPEGMQRFRLGKGPDIPFTADRLRAWLPLEPDAPGHSVDLDASNLRFGIQGESNAASGLTIGTLSVHGVAKAGAPAGETTMTVLLAAAAVGLPPRQRSPLGSHIEQMRLEAGLTGPLAPARGLTARAHAWREGGGSLEVHQASLKWGSLALQADGTFALDEHLQPTGTGIARATGDADVLDTLAANGVLSRSTATAAKAVLSLLARASADDGTAEVEVPLTLESRTLSLRQMPLLRIPEIVWP